MRCHRKISTYRFLIIVRASIARPGYWRSVASHFDASSSNELDPQNESSITEFAHQLFQCDDDFCNPWVTGKFPESVQTDILPASSQSYQSQREDNQHGESVVSTNPSYDIILHGQGSEKPTASEDFFRSQKRAKHQQHQQLQQVAYNHDQRNYGHGVLPNYNSFQSDFLPAPPQSYLSQQNHNTPLQAQENNQLDGSIAFIDPNYDLILHGQGSEGSTASEEFFRYQRRAKHKQHQQVQQVALHHDQRNYGHGALPNYSNGMTLNNELAIFNGGITSTIEKLKTILRQKPLFPNCALKKDLNEIIKRNKSHKPVSEIIEDFRTLSEKVSVTRKFPLAEFPKMRCGKLLVRYYPELSDDFRATGNGFLQFLTNMEDPVPVPRYIITKRLKTLLGWLWYCHEELLNSQQIKVVNQKEAQASLFQWLWKNFSEPDEKDSLPVNGWAKIPEPFDETAYGISQRFIIDCLTHTQKITDVRQMLLDSCAVGLLAAFYKCPYGNIMNSLWRRSAMKASWWKSPGNIMRKKNKGAS